MLPVVPLRRLARTALLAMPAMLAACGGGGGGGGATATSSVAAVTTSAVFAPSASLANQCSVEGHKQWVRSYLDEAYLWYDKVQESAPAASPTPAEYFNALLVRAPDATGQATDRFSTVMPTAVADAMQGIGSSASGSPAAAAGNPVPLVKKVLSSAGRRVGYVLFNQHSRGAQDALIDAFTQLRSAAVQDLVLDLRYNPGGFIYIAQVAASMVAGPGIDGQVFETARYSNKRAADSAAGAFYFSSQVETTESLYPAGTPLPQLNLPRLYVLTSTYTCSASESIVNALRGIGVQVILVGDRTCGKPYGFHRKDNCGQAHFPIEFQLANAQGFGDYQGGFPVQCRVQENPLTSLGAANEPLLAAALKHIDTGACPLQPAIAAQATVAGSLFDRMGAPAQSLPAYHPGWNGRQLLQ